ncbi:hypothetical protein FQV39_03205 [Bosea sp. F3-2]|uniref:hypothetical protein n=1 Tax=Bosea sp. F3-2 TaxID=2599640 RepID=UPI0011EF6E55|nr:hypothetical protein [Bosea sp. F3-2]QEL21697.1 hypothetical protein FQV39_03205 [Bosea sp. F3-2]
MSSDRTSPAVRQILDEASLWGEWAADVKRRLDAVEPGTPVPADPQAFFTRRLAVEQIIRDAEQAGYLDELKRQLAAIDGRPAPDPETSLSPQTRPPRRKPKGPRP